MSAELPQPRTWIETAERARSLLQGQDTPGNRMRAQNDAADRLGVRTTTLRSYLDALSTIQKMASIDGDCATIMRRLPVDAVRAIGRWARFDIVGAVEFLRQHPDLSAGVARKAEQSARKKATVNQPSFWENSIAPGIPSTQHLQLKSAIANHFWHGQRQFPWELPQIYEQYLASLAYQHTVDSYERDLGLDGVAWLDPQKIHDQDRLELFEAYPGHFPPLPNLGYGLCAVMKAPHFSVQEYYRREAKGLQFRAILAAELYPLVLLPLPTAEARDEVIKGLSSLPQEKFYLAHGRRSDPLPAYLEISEPHLIFSGPTRGVVVITSASTITSDLFAPYR